MRVLIESLHIAAGVAAALLIAALASWAYPLARHDIWLVTWFAIAGIAIMGFGSLRRAVRAQRAAKGGDDAGS